MYLPPWAISSVPMSRSPTAPRWGYTWVATSSACRLTLPLPPSCRLPLPLSKPSAKLARLDAQSLGQERYLAPLGRALRESCLFSGLPHVSADVLALDMPQPSSGLSIYIYVAAQLRPVYI